MVQRDESNSYESIIYYRLTEVCNALEATIPIMTVN
jgi:hypothetical protein